MNTFEEAKALFSQAIDHLQKEEWEAAEALLKQSLKLVPDRPSTLNNLAAVQLKLRKFEEAQDTVQKALWIDQNMATAWANRATLLYQHARHEEALQSSERAVELQPDYAEAHLCRGIILKSLERPEAACDSFQRAIQLKPALVEARNDLGNILRDLGRLDEALTAYERALELKPDYPYLYGNRLIARMALCKWEDRESEVAELITRIRRNERAMTCFYVLALTDSMQIQRKAAEIWANDNHPDTLALPAIPKRARHRKLRLGYYSADFRHHAVAYLAAELFELHDRTGFEIAAFSFGPDTNDDMRQRLCAAFDTFIDVRGKSDREIALLSRDREIDIAVDLSGFTQNSRAGIFAHRAAPIQVGYLGYPGTTGTGHIDYLIADRTVVPEACRGHYSEKMVYLPHCFQVNDRKRSIASKVYSRVELGLPATGFVFCCLNNSYKITPDVFDGWMRILKRVEGSVLWLLKDNPMAADNLRREAARRQIDPDRLVFATRAPYGDYLARLRAADLFLDSLPFNAGTTASDALWAGLPVLTRRGKAFASRMAASLLTAIDLPELITDTKEDYESLAVELATNPQRLDEIRQKLARNRLTAPLFDTPRFTRHLEEAYQQMYERCQAGLPPDHIYVRP